MAKRSKKKKSSSRSRSPSPSPSQCPGIGPKRRLKKGFKHRKGGLKNGCPIRVKK